MFDWVLWIHLWIHVIKSQKQWFQILLRNSWYKRFREIPKKILATGKFCNFLGSERVTLTKIAQKFHKNSHSFFVEILWHLFLKSLYEVKSKSKVLQKNVMGCCFGRVSCLLQEEFFEKAVLKISLNQRVKYLRLRPYLM